MCASSMDYINVDFFLIHQHLYLATKSIKQKRKLTQMLKK